MNTKKYDTIEFSKTEIEKLSIFEKKDKIQNAALLSYKNNNECALIAAATRTGKSRIGVLAAKDKVIHRQQAKILIVVPTQKLRDKNWQEEFEKWDAANIYENNVVRCCYASLAKFKNEYFTLVILDEAHNITENNSQFFKNNTWHSILALTATPPKNGENKQILNSLCPTVFVYTLDQAVNHGVVAPYEIFIVKTQLDDIDRYIEVNLKNNRKFNVTEKERYGFLCSVIETTRTKLAQLGDACKQTKFCDFSFTRDEFDAAEYYKMKKKEFEEFIEGFTEDYKEDLRKYRENKQQLEFWTNKHKFQMLDRMRFIYNLKSKKEAAKFLLDNFIGQNSKTIVFCGSINQANELCGDNVFHSGVKDIALNKFFNDEITVLGVVEALNEGITIENVENEIVVQVNSNEKDIVQRIGRSIGFKEDHIATIFIVCCSDTQDESWVEKATKNLDESRISEIEISELKMIV